MSRRINLEAATRAVLGRESDDDESRRGVRPTPKVTLPRVAFLERPLPDWFNEPIPKPARRKAR